VIRLWLSLFALYRILDVRGKLKLKTITSPSTADLGLLGEWSNFTIHVFWPWIKDKYSRKDSVTDALHDGPLKFLKSLKAKAFVILKSSPIFSAGELGRIASASPLAILLAAREWWQCCRGSADYSRRALWLAFESWCKMTKNIWVLNRIEAWGSGQWEVAPTGRVLTREGKLALNLASVEEQDVSLADQLDLRKPRSKDKPFSGYISHALGKLGFKQEPAGKVRVFAMVDCFTQWIMKPLHDAIFLLLELIPQDGTFNQIKPLERVLKRQAQLRSTKYPPGTRLPLSGSWDHLKKSAKETWGLFSFDLSAATDRLPLVFQKALLSPILGAWGAECWGTLLVGRLYLKTKQKSLGSPGEDNLAYGAGQPMGALSSWALLALTHHCIVQWAWYLVCKNTNREWTWYEDYAVLGDDIVILGVDVARKYVDLMRLLGVEIGLHKSVLSRDGSGLEFAKRTYYKGKDVSAVPLPELRVAQMNISALLELGRKYSWSLGTMTRFLGYGYKTRGALTKRLMSLPSRIRNYILAYSSPGGIAPRKLFSWLTMRSTLANYMIDEARCLRLINKFITLESQALLKVLDNLQPMIQECIRLGTVYRDREHYGTDFKKGKRIRMLPGLSLEVPLQVQDSISETVYRDSFLSSVSEARELRTKVEDLSREVTPKVETSTTQVSASPEKFYSQDHQSWVRRLSLDEYNSRLLTAYMPMMRYPGCPPFVAATEVPDGFVAACSEPEYETVSVEVPRSEQEIDQLSVKMTEFEDLWERVRLLEQTLSSLPLPRSLLITSGITKSLTAMRDVRKWERYSSLFRSTV
jgi:hypothetical protein